jgi:hypothetical protein
MKNKIKELKKDIQNEIYRLQMLDYPSSKSYDYLSELPTHAIGDGMGFKGQRSN